MFGLLGRMVARIWPVLLAGWIAVLIGMNLAAPAWDDVAESGQFSFLPKNVPSNRGKDLFQAAFPNKSMGSNIVIVLSRDDEVPIYENQDFIERDLKAGLFEIAEKEGGLADDNYRAGQSESNKKKTQGTDAPQSERKRPRSPIVRIQTLGDEGKGTLLVNGYQNATLVVVDLTAEFLDRSAWPPVHAVEELIERLYQENKVPEGLDIALTGSAVVGRDFRQAELQSAHTIETWTIWLVIGLLLIIYRAPLLALIPIITVFFAVQISINLLSLMAEHHWLTLSETNRIYITVLAYGAGVDYCLFLIARYREELATGEDLRQALANAIGKVGGTVTASAATVICGIAMLALSKFGKYHQAGITIPLSLGVVLLSALTFSPSLLRLTGRWAFWPTKPERGHTNSAPATHRRFWDRIGQALQRRPGTIWLASVIFMAPFAVIAVRNYNYLDYGLTHDLPPGAPSLEGTEELKRHFAAGITGQTTVLVRKDTVDFTSTEGHRLIGSLAARIEDRKDELQIDDVRSIAQPLGTSPAAKEIMTRLERLSIPDEYRMLQEQSREYYVSDAGELKGHVTRLDIISHLDPLSPRSIENFARIERVLQDQLPRELQGSEIGIIGSTASLRDLQQVTQEDMRFIEVAVPVVVFVILVILLRQIIASVYLVATVLFSYLATLGVTFAVFWWLDPTGFSGLDWKVPIFLFTILVAVGEDYNIFLMTRVKEEQRRHGPVLGVTEAVVRTGGIISSCGFIMAGTFASLLSGTLVEMKELGFALAFGVLLDTLVVRPLLVPAFLILAEKGRAGGTRKAPAGQAA
jgi:RND superfamily putative drug exporter